MFHVKPGRDDRRQLMESLFRAGLTMDQEGIDRCIAYWHLLLEAPRHLNLISRKSLASGPLRHIGDALMALARWECSGGRTLLDIGSGGGLPGLPLALAVPDLSVTLLEPKERKADWLQQAITHLNCVPRVTVRMSRFEEIDWKETSQYDLATVRAVAPPEQALRLILPALGPDAILLLWHSARQTGAIEGALAGVEGDRGYTPDYTLSYFFDSINFSSCITGIRKAH
jgi:16S rRNA (guanine527-N7)-methyltransferase